MSETKLREAFEQNMLDGDSMDGAVLINAREVFDYFIKDVRYSELQALLEQVKEMHIKKHWNSRYSKEESCIQDGFCVDCQRADQDNYVVSKVEHLITALMNPENG